MTYLKTYDKKAVGIIFMLLASLLVSLGQLFWKISGFSNILLMLLGFLSYGLGAAFMLTAFRFGPLSVLHPMLSVTYILALVLGYFVFGEAISFLKMAGIVTISLGIALLGASHD